MGRQLEFEFDSRRRARDAGDRAVRHLLAEAIAGSGRSREAICERLTRATGRRITVHMLNAWTAPSRGAWQFPFWLAPAFDRICGTEHLLRFHAEHSGISLLDPRDVLAVELGRIDIAEADLRRRRRALKERR